MDSPILRRLVSLVIPCYNESDVFPRLEQALVALADRLCQEFEIEIVLVDDGSKDATWAQIREFGRQIPGFGESLCREISGTRAALTCGYDLTPSGDAVVCMDADLQDPPGSRRGNGAEMERWIRSGPGGPPAARRRNAVQTVDGGSLLPLDSLLGAERVTADTGDFRLSEPPGPSMRALGQMREYHRFIRGMVGLVGFRRPKYIITGGSRKAGTTKYPLRKMLSLRPTRSSPFLPSR